VFWNYKQTSSAGASLDFHECEGAADPICAGVAYTTGALVRAAAAFAALLAVVAGGRCPACEQRSAAHRGVAPFCAQPACD
jgi:hypothetical protein